MPPNGYEHGNISHRAARGDDDGSTENSITRNEHKREAEGNRAGGGLDSGGAHLSIRHGHEEADRPGRRGDQFTAEQNQERQVSRLEPRAEKTEKVVSETDQDQRRCQRRNKRAARRRVGESCSLEKSASAKYCEISGEANPEIPSSPKDITLASRCAAT